MARRDRVLVIAATAPIASALARVEEGSGTKTTWKPAMPEV